MRRQMNRALRRRSSLAECGALPIQAPPELPSASPDSADTEMREKLTMCDRNLRLVTATFCSGRLASSSLASRDRID